MQVDGIQLQLGQPSVHKGKATYTGQGTSVRMSMRQHAQGHPMTMDRKNQKQYWENKANCRSGKGIKFCSKAKQSKAQGCFWSDWFSCGTGRDLMNFSNFYHETEILKGIGDDMF